MSRNDRLAEQIRRELSLIIQMEMRDPRLGMVSVSAVELSRDMSFAKVFFTVLKVEDKEITAQVLNKSAGFLKKQLSDRMLIRVLPKLNFVYDESVERGRKLSSLIDQALLSDAHQSAEPESADSETPEAQ